MDILPIVTKEYFSFLIDTLIYLIERISTFENENFIIIETNNTKNSFIITNRISDIIKYLKINCSFYQIGIKNYVSDYLKHFSYYSTFSLLFLLNLMKKSQFLIAKWGEKKLILQLFEKLGLEILQIMKKMQIKLCDGCSVYKNFANNFHKSEDFHEEAELLQIIFEDFQKKSQKVLLIQVIYFSYSIEMRKSHIEKGYCLKFDENHTNIGLLNQYLELNIQNFNEEKYLKFEKCDLLLIETENVDFEKELSEHFPQPLDFIEKMHKKQLKLLITNGFLTDSITYTFFAENIMIIGNIKMKDLRNIGKIMDKKLIFFAKIAKNMFSSKDEKKTFEIKILLKPDNKKKYYFILKTNDSEFAFYNMFLRFSSEPKTRRIKHFIKCSIDKFQSLLKFKKCLIGGGAFELKIAHILKQKKNKKELNKKKEFIKEEIRIAIADIFEEMIERLFRNQGLDYAEIENKKHNLKKKENRFFEENGDFFDEYKAKKFCIENAFLYLKIFSKNSFLN